MRRNALPSLLAAWLLGAGAVRAGDVGSAEWLERDALVAAVLARHPSIEAARQAWRAAAARPAALSSLDDPMVAYGVAPLSIGAGDADFGQELEIAQPFALRGLRRLRADAAQAEAVGFEADLETVRQELARRAALLHVDYALATEGLRINGEHAGLLEDLLGIATSRYAAGLASQQDPLQAEVELAHVQHDAVRLRAEQRIVMARINALLARAPDVPLPPPAWPAAGEEGLDLRAEHDVRDAVGPVDAAAREASAARSPAAIAGDPFADAGIPRAAGSGPHSPAARGAFREDAPARRAAPVGERPELVSLAAAIEARRAELHLVRRAGRPSFTAMASWSSMWSDREHRLMIGGSVALPVRRARIRAEVAAAEARLSQAESVRAVAELDVRLAVWQATERLHESRHILDLYASRLLPAARDRVDAAVAGFVAGRNDFLAVIDAERRLRDVELGRYQALAERERNEIELARAEGCPLGGAGRSDTGGEP